MIVVVLILFCRNSMIELNTIRSLVVTNWADFGKRNIHL